MNKAELINAVAAESGLSRVDSKKTLEVFLFSAIKALSAGDKISLIGPSTFPVTERAERSSINPSIRKAITIPAKKVAKFKPDTELIDAIR